MSDTRIEPMTPNQLPLVAAVHRDAFPLDGNTMEDSARWIEAKFRGWPANRYYLALQGDEVVGYILWIEMGGFREECVLSLEQIGVETAQRGRGIGTRLIDESLFTIVEDLAAAGRSLKLVEVNTGVANQVQRLYSKTLGAAVEAKLRDFFDDDEVVMLARRRDIDSARKSRRTRVLPVP